MNMPVITKTRSPRWRQRILRLMPWHRRLAMLACVGIFCWAGSGMLHPLMGFLQVRPATMMGPTQVLPLDELRSPAEVLGAAGIARVRELRLLQLEGEPYYQARLHAQEDPRYWHARSGQEIDLQARHAESLARHYLGSDETLSYSGTLSRFNGEYAFINRLLPVARVDTGREDGLRLYLDLYQDRLGTLVDNRKAWFSGFFQTLHSFGWLDAAGPLRPILMFLLLASIISATLIGLGLFFARRRSASGVRRLHGWTGLGLAITTLSFASSGAFHLLHKQLADPLPEGFSASLPVADLTAAPSAAWLPPGEQLYRLSLIPVGGQPVWRAQANRQGLAENAYYISAAGREMPDESPNQYIAERLAFYANALELGEGREPAIQDRFDHDYGFVFKRLPVLKSQYADAANTTLFIDPLDGALAARVRDADRAESGVFSYLHKWELVGVFGHTAKQAVVALLGLLHVLLALMGLYLLARPRRAGNGTT